MSASGFKAHNAPRRLGEGGRRLKNDVSGIHRF
jgi:hypothetical protein